MYIEENIKNGGELYSWFFQNRHNKDGQLEKGLFVSENVRQQVMTSEKQNRVILEGRYYNISWEDMKGGVWRVFLDLTAKEKNFIQNN